jgi:metal-responsive CopG/Arc/MetJ family transcriptional regulator
VNLIVSDFIPKQYKKDPITIRIDFKKLDKIDKLAAQYNLSRSEFINQCIDYALENMSKTKQADK